MIKGDTGLTTIEQVREEYFDCYDDGDLLDKIQMKCWLNHSESRHKNNNKPFTFSNYINHMRISDYSQQVQLGMINVDDLGGKDRVLALLTLNLSMK